MNSKKRLMGLLAILLVFVVGSVLYWQVKIRPFQEMFAAFEQEEGLPSQRSEQIPEFDPESLAKSIKLKLVQEKDVVFTKSQIPAPDSWTPHENHWLEITHVLTRDGVQVDSWNEKAVQHHCMLAYQKGFSADKLVAQQRGARLAYHVAFSVWKKHPESSSSEKLYEGRTDPVKLQVNEKTKS